ncbi:hypothetical protein EN35_32830 [Rhodococcus qingshengii]|nr:hypothetical protein EN35_32830 [Rhodococcus qingshengii]
MTVLEEIVMNGAGLLGIIMLSAWSPSLPSSSSIGSRRSVNDGPPPAGSELPSAVNSRQFGEQSMRPSLGS